MWAQHKSIHYYLPVGIPTGPQPIAGLDMGGTLVNSESGDVTIKEWVWASPSVPEILTELRRLGWLIVIFSNASPKHVIQERYQEIWDALGFDFITFVSVHNSTAKPGIAMWQLFQEVTKIEPIKGSFYCGDKTGEVGMKATDREFAEKVGLEFMVPDDLFPRPDIVVPDHVELVIMVGQQGAGKSTIARKLRDEHGYTIVARDKKSLRKIEELLKSGKSVVFDATNPSRESRKPFIALAQSLEIPVRVFWITRSGRTFNALRRGRLLDTGAADPDHNKPVPDIALRTYTREFERPSTDEGVQEVVLF